MADKMDKNPENEKKEFSFIKEKIVPKKQNKIKKIVDVLIVTILLAIIFGIVSRYIFTISEPLFDKVIGKEDDTPILTVPSVNPSEKVKQEYEEKDREDKNSKNKDNDSEKNDEKIVLKKPLTLEDYEELNSKMVSLANIVNNSIVTVTGVKDGVDWLNNPDEKNNTTYGTVFSEDSTKLYVFTVYSKVKGSKHIKVTLHGSETLNAKLKGYDKELDIAVIMINKEDISEYAMNKIRKAELGMSYSLAPGKSIIALGNPNGYTYSMEFGMITGKQTAAYITDNRVELYNTDINNNENGEGIIVNLKGEIIGVITHKFKDSTNSDVNTVLSISRVSPILNKIVEGKARPYFGVIAEDITPDIAKKLGIQSGIYVSEVQTSSPALEAGLQNGDIILKVDSEIISSVNGFNSILSNYQIKSKMSVIIKRGKEVKEIKVEIGKKK